MDKFEDNKKASINDVAKHVRLENYSWGAFWSRTKNSTCESGDIGDL